jgi:uncharacterized protein YkwD
MLRKRLGKFRLVWVAGITAVVVGGGAVFAYGAWGNSSPDQISLASRSAARAQPRATGTPSAEPSSAAVHPAQERPRKAVHRAQGHRHRHGRPTAHPTPTTARPTPTKPTATATKSTTPPTPPASGGSKTEQYRTEVIRLVNVERAKVGCTALKANSALTEAAQAHASDMLANNYFSHDSQNGTNPFDRMTAAGYHWSAAAENIAAGQQTPADVMQSWMNSDGHRANILNCGLKDIGVGYAAGSGADYGQYWVQDFGSPA